jgi:hypothetical protein
MPSRIAATAEDTPPSYQELDKIRRIVTQTKPQVTAPAAHPTSGGLSLDRCQVGGVCGDLVIRDDRCTEGK